MTMAEMARFDPISFARSSAHKEAFICAAAYHTKLPNGDLLTQYRIKAASNDSRLDINRSQDGIIIVCVVDGFVEPPAGQLLPPDLDAFRNERFGITSRDCRFSSASSERVIEAHPLEAKASASTEPSSTQASTSILTFALMPLSKAS